MFWPIAAVVGLFGILSLIRIRRRIAELRYREPLDPTIPSRQDMARIMKSFTKTKDARLWRQWIRGALYWQAQSRYGCTPAEAEAEVADLLSKYDVQAEVRYVNG